MCFCFSTSLGLFVAQYLHAQYSGMSGEVWHFMDVFCMHSLIIWCRCLPTCFQRFEKVCCDAVCFSNKVYHSSAFELWWDCRISYIFSRWFSNVSCSKSLAAQPNLQTMVLEFISADITIEVHSFCRPLEHRHGLLIKNQRNLTDMWRKHD